MRVVAQSPTDRDEDHRDIDDGFQNVFDDFGNHPGDYIHPNCGVGITENFAHLSRKRTLGDAEIQRHIDVPKQKLTQEETEVCDFLRGMENGSGTSLRQIQGVLNCAKKHEGATALLLKSAISCWNIVARVSNRLLESQYNFFYSTF